MNKAGRKKTPLKRGMHRGFRSGMGMVPMAMVPEVRETLMSIIGGETRSKYLAYMCGKTIIYPDISRKIERVFIAHGVPRSAVWDM